MRNVYTGSYTRVDGSVLRGPSVSDRVPAANPRLDAEVRQRMDAALASMQVLVDTAEKDGIAYDQLIAAGNAAGNAKVMDAINALLDQTRSVEKAVTDLPLDTAAQSTNARTIVLTLRQRAADLKALLRQQRPQSTNPDAAVQPPERIHSYSDSRWDNHLRWSPAGLTTIPR